MNADLGLALYAGSIACGVFGTAGMTAAKEKWEFVMCFSAIALCFIGFTLLFTFGRS